MTAVRFGLFALVSVLVATAMVMRIGNLSLDGEVRHEAVFRNVGGLDAGDDVRLAGVRVGRVTDVSVVEGRARVVFGVDPTVALPTDTLVRVQWVDLVGQNELLLVPGQATTTLEPGQQLTHTRSATDLAATLDTLGPLMQALDPARMNTLTRAIATMLDGREPQVEQLVGELDAALATFTEREQVIDQLITDYATIGRTIATREEQIQRLVDDLTSLVEAFDASDAALASSVSQAGRMLTGLDALLARSRGDVEAVLADLGQVTDAVAGDLERLDEGVAGLPTALSGALTALGRGDTLAVGGCLRVTDPPCARVETAGTSVLDVSTPHLHRMLLGGSR